MGRQRSIMAFATACVLSVLVLLSGTERSSARPSDIEKVKAAIDAYHAAIESRALSKIEPLWDHEPNVTLVNPGSKTIYVGWDSAKKNWESDLAAYSELKITKLEGPYVQTKGRTAWSTGLVTASFKSKTGESKTVTVLETDVFVRRHGAWLLVTHTASPRP
jgi:ketosteroid isomerase-like protein